MTEVCGLSPELRANWSQLTWPDRDLQCLRVLSSFLFLQGSLKPCFHTITEKNSDRCDHMEAILYNRNDSSDNDRGKSYLSGSLRSLESGFHMIATITELFFSAIKRKTRLSSKYAPRYCCVTLVIFKAQHPVTAHVPNFAFLTGCREFRRCEESKRALKNPFASRLAEFDTTLKLPRITDQQYIVPVKSSRDSNENRLTAQRF